MKSIAVPLLAFRYNQEVAGSNPVGSTLTISHKNTPKGGVFVYYPSCHPALFRLGEVEMIKKKKSIMCG